jgi:hypothetical protein
MIEIEKAHTATSIGGLAGGLMAATLLNPTVVPMEVPHVQNLPVVVAYPAAANTYGVYSSLFTSGRLGATVAQDSIVSFYSNLLAKQERLGKQFEQVLFDNLWDLYSR